MTSRDFCFWLQGFFEVHAADYDKGTPLTLSSHRVDAIRRHLALVFAHEIDPSMGPQEHQAKLDELHQAAVAADEPWLKKPPTQPNHNVKMRC